MKKFNLYTLVICSSILLGAPAYAISEGSGGGRGANAQDNSGGRGGVSIERHSMESWFDESTETQHSIELSDIETSDPNGNDLTREADPTARQGTGPEEAAANFGIAGDRAAGAPNSALGHHGNDVNPDIESTGLGIDR